VPPLTFLPDTATRLPEHFSTVTRGHLRPGLLSFTYYRTNVYSTMGDTPKTTGNSPKIRGPLAADKVNAPAATWPPLSVTDH
jgi:hypothetical protein